MDILYRKMTTCQWQVKYLQYKAHPTQTLLRDERAQGKPQLLCGVHSPIVGWLGEHQ